LTSCRGDHAGLSICHFCGSGAHAVYAASLEFTPVAAALLYFGARGSKRQLWVPFALLAASDVILTKFVYSYPFSWDHFVTWAWYAAILCWAHSCAKTPTGCESPEPRLASSVSFFVVSNFAVWACWNMYPKTLSGLMTCYAAGVPFFRRGVAGDLLFTAAMFGLPAVAAMLSRSATSRKEPPPPRRISSCGRTVVLCPPLVSQAERSSKPRFGRRLTPDCQAQHDRSHANRIHTKWCAKRFPVSRHDLRAEPERQQRFYQKTQ
jgi:hypothetical protein